MKTAQKYFIFNKEPDYQAGYTKNLIFSDGELSITGGQQSGYFISPLLDSGEKDTQWHEMLLQCVVNGMTSGIEVMIYTAREEKGIPHIIQDKELTLEEKQRELDHFLIKKKDGETEILLHDTVGRYLWFFLILTRQGKCSPRISGMKIIFPKESWMGYLPEIYQKDKTSASFVERYLGVFQSMQEEMTKKIARMPKYFDPEVTEEEFLPELAEWLALQDSILWEKKKLRYLLANAARLYRKRGTAEYLADILEIYIGKRPYIIENHQIQPYMTSQLKRRLLEQLYGASSYIFTVAIDVEEKINRKDIEVIKRIVENEKPAHMESRVVLLEPHIFLDCYSYLGMNSVLSDFGAMVLDGQASLPFTRLKEMDEKGTGDNF